MIFWGMSCSYWDQSLPVRNADSDIRHFGVTRSCLFKVCNEVEQMPANPSRIIIFFPLHNFHDSILILAKCTTGLCML